jgi:predicted dehydrogenase
MTTKNIEREKAKAGRCVGQAAPPGMARREFLKSGASVGAGLVLAAKAMAQEEGIEKSAQPVVGPPPGETSADQVNIAMIGLGAEGMVLMDAILRIPGIRIKAVCDIWEYSRQRGERTPQKYGHDVKAYEDYRDMLAAHTDLDAAIVATPDFVHHEHTIACLKSGMHVYCEKEMSNSVEKAREMVVAARETGKLLQIGHQRRSNPRYIHAINRLVHEGKLLGQVTHANGQWNRAKSVDEGWPRQWEIPQATLEKYGYDSMHHFRNWRWYKKYGGGPIVDLGSHQIDIFTWVFGCNPSAVLAAGGVDFYKNHEWYDNVMTIFDYDTPAGVSRAFYQVLTTSSNGGYFETFMGEEGTLIISEIPFSGNLMLREARAPEAIKELWERVAKEGALMRPLQQVVAAAADDVLVDVRASKPPDAWELPVQLNKPAHQPHLENFFDAIRIGKALTCPAEIGYETAVAVHKVNDAVEAGRKLHFAPEEFVV